MGKLQACVLDAYDRMIGLDMADIAVDGCITKAPCGGEQAGRSSVNRGKIRPQVLDRRRRHRHPARGGRGSHHSGRFPLLEPTLAGEGHSQTPVRVRLDLGYDFEDDPRETPRPCPRPWSAPADRREGQTGTGDGHQTVGGGTHQSGDQRLQEAGVVYGAPGG